MKKIINGRIYDTDRATLIGEYWNGLSLSNFEHWKAGLYKTPRSGRYFLAGTGGPMTRFSHPSGNMISGGKKIIPLSEEEALDWSEKYLSTKAIEEHFSHLIKDA